MGSSPRPRESWRTSAPDEEDPRGAERSWIARAWRFFSREVWQSDLARLTRLNRYGYRTARVMYLAGRGFVQDNCLFRASALTYITVLSLVPLLAFSFSVAKGFGFYQRLIDDSIQPFIDRTFAGSEEMRTALMRVLDFVNGTDVSALGIPGLVLLIYTVLKLLSTIERSFNDIWAVQRSRSILRKLSDYLTMVIVAPIFLFVATGLTLAAENNFVVDYLRRSTELGPVIDLVLKLFPLFAMWLGFSFVYLALPNSRTRISSAALGGLVAAILWQIALVLHIKFQIGIARYNALYSSFAAFPIFLMWINVCWITVLFGAEVCFAHESEESYMHIARSRPADHAFKEIVALRAMTRIGERFLSGEDPWTVSALSAELSVPQRTLQELLGLLVRRGLLADLGVGQEDLYLPARDLETITIKSVLDALKGTTGPVDVPTNASVDREIDRLMAGLNHEASASGFNRTVRALAEAALREKSDAADPAPSTANSLGHDALGVQGSVPPSASAGRDQLAGARSRNVAPRNP
jgi:membrane protein